MFLTPTPYGGLLILAILALMAWHVWKVRQQGRWLLFDPLLMFLAGVIVVFVLSPLEHAEQFVDWHRAGCFDKTLLATLFGCAFVILGYEAKLGQNLGRKLPPIAPELAPGRLLVAGVVLLVLTVLGYMLNFYMVGGIDVYLAVGRGWAEIVRTPPILGHWSSLFLQAQNLLPVGCLILLYRANLYRLPAGSHIVAWLVGGLMWLWFFYLGTRSRLIYATLILLSGYYLPRRKSPPLWLAGLLFPCLILITSFQGEYRHKFTNLSLHFDEINREEMWQNILPSWLNVDSKKEKREIARGAEFNCAMAVIELVPDQVPYNYGYGKLELLTRWIPKGLWPGQKPYPALEAIQGVLREGSLSDYVEPSSGLLAAPCLTFVGDYYYMGGFMALAIGSFITGVCLRVVRTLYDRSAGNHSYLFLYPVLMLNGFLDAVGSPFYWVFYAVAPLAGGIVMLKLCSVSRGNRPARTKRPLKRHAGGNRKTHLTQSVPDESRRPVS